MAAITAPRSIPRSSTRRPAARDRSGGTWVSHGSARPRAARPASSIAALVAQVGICVGLAAAYLGQALDIVFRQRIGAVVADLGGGHGVHQGDVLALPLAAFACLALLAAMGCIARWERAAR